MVSPIAKIHSLLKRSIAIRFSWGHIYWINSYTAPETGRLIINIILYNVRIVYKYCFIQLRNLIKYVIRIKFRDGKQSNKCRCIDFSSDYSVCAIRVSNHNGLITHHSKDPKWCWRDAEEKLYAVLATCLYKCCHVNNMWCVLASVTWHYKNSLNSINFKW